jgi:nucleoside-diphosphate-sugar epimerase
MGAINVLGLAKRVNAKVLQASTSEVYGDPHPQPESYWDNNPLEFVLVMMKESVVRRLCLWITTTKIMLQLKSFVYLTLMVPI